MAKPERRAPKSVESPERRDALDRLRSAYDMNLVQWRTLHCALNVGDPIDLPTGQEWLIYGWLVRPVPPWTPPAKFAQRPDFGTIQLLHGWLIEAESPLDALMDAWYHLGESSPTAADIAVDAGRKLDGCLARLDEHIKTWAEQQQPVSYAGRSPIVNGLTDVTLGMVAAKAAWAAWMSEVLGPYARFALPVRVTAKRPLEFRLSRGDLQGIQVTVYGLAKFPVI